MRRFILLCACALLCQVQLYSRAARITGYVYDEKHTPLPGASVISLPSGQGTIADTKGYFELTLGAADTAVQFAFLGYQSITYSRSKLRTAMQIVMQPATEQLDEVVVKDNYDEQIKKEEAMNIEIVHDDYLKQNLGGSLMQSLESLPGVSSIDIGAGQSKPVIRGLSFNRVVVVENGIKHEGQQWGADHGLELDQYAVDKLEVIKGPASLMYGSDAIGGIIHIKQNDVPKKYSYGGTVDLTGKTNNDLFGSSLALYARKEHVFAKFRFTWSDYGDFKVPTDSVDIYDSKIGLYKNRVRNTAGEEKDVHLTLGYINETFQSKWFISNIYSKSGFFANAHGLEPRSVDNEVYDASSRDILYPYQTVNHFKVIGKNQWTTARFKTEADVGFQENFRQEWSEYIPHGYMPEEFPDTLGFDAELERQFDKHIYSGNVKTIYFRSERTTLSAGIDNNYQDNNISGVEFIIPSYEQLNIGSFFFAKHKFSGKSIMSAGIRYDFGMIHTHSYRDWFPSQVVENGDTTMQYLERAKNLRRTFSSVSWSVGYNYNLEKWSIKANVGKSFRMPIAKELAADGVNYHHFSYEVGNSDLSPEISYQLDIGIEYSVKKFSIGISPFLNYFSNYIYLNPSSEHDSVTGLQIFNYTQSKVFRYGGEINGKYKILKSLTLGLTGEYTYSEQLSGAKKGYTLPFSPPADLIFSVEYSRPKAWHFSEPYIRLDYKLTAAQNNIVPPEEPTDGYQLVNILFGGDIRLRKQVLRISLQVQNLFDTKYFNHTGYYRLMNIPEPGRNAVINITIPFEGNFKTSNN